MLAGKPAPDTKAKERPKKEAGHSRLGCGSFKRQEHNQGFSWVAARPVAFCIYPQVYTAALIGLKNVQCPDGLNTVLLFQSCPWAASSLRKTSREYIPIWRVKGW